MTCNQDVTCQKGLENLCVMLWNGLNFFFKCSKYQIPCNQTIYVPSPLSTDLTEFHILAISTLKQIERMCWFVVAVVVFSSYEMSLRRSDTGFETWIHDWLSQLQRAWGILNLAFYAESLREGKERRFLLLMHSTGWEDTISDSITYPTSYQKNGF